MATAALWFALEYADLGRFLTRRTLGLLALPPVLVLVLVTDGSLRLLLCSGYTLEAQVRCVLGPAGRILTAYGFVLALASSLVFLWLFVRSPLHRWPAAFCLCGHVVVRAGFLLDVSDANPVAPMDATILASGFTGAMYAVALFGFRMFELIPVARGTVLEQMQEGVLVLDRAAAGRGPEPRRGLDPRHHARSGRGAVPRPTSCRRSRARARGPRTPKRRSRRSSSARAPPRAGTRSSYPPCSTGVASGSASWSCCTT